MVVVPTKLTILELFKVVYVKRYWYTLVTLGAQWLSGRLLNSRPRVTTLCALARNIDPSLVLVYPRKTCPYITEDC